jgi:multidrug transporter EmrE-like cation transporter
MTPTLGAHRAFGFAAAGVTVVLTVYGQGVAKWRVDRAPDAPDGVSQQLVWALELLLDPWVWTVAIAVVVASMAWLAAVSQLELSVAYPLMSTSLILVVLLAALTFDEPLTVAKIGGAVLVLAGLIVSSWPSAPPSPTSLRGEQTA